MGTVRVCETIPLNDERYRRFEPEVGDIVTVAGGDYEQRLVDAGIVERIPDTHADESEAASSPPPAVTLDEGIFETIATVKAWLETGPTGEEVEQALVRERLGKDRVGAIDALEAYKD